MQTMPDPVRELDSSQHNLRNNKDRKLDLTYIATNRICYHCNKSTTTSHGYTSARAVDYGLKAPYVNVTRTDDALKAAA